MSVKAAATRLNILQKAFGLVYQNGYRTTSVDDIIATTQVTKGAFFYHFKHKDGNGPCYDKRGNVSRLTGCTN